jgi:hypothetical protein
VPRFIESGGAGDLFEGAVAAVAVEDVGFAGVGEGAGIGAGVLFRIGLGDVSEIIAEVEIEEAVVVDVGKGGGDTGAGVSDAGGLGDILEGAVAAVSVEDVGADIDDVEVGVAVVIKVAGGGGAAEAGAFKTGLEGDVRRCRRRGCGRVGWVGAGLGELGTVTSGRGPN